MTQIQPINFPFVGMATQLKVLILNFQTNATTCTTYNELLTDEGVMCSNWNYTLTEAEFAAWGLDNSYIDDIVAKDKGITIISE